MTRANMRGVVSLITIAGFFVAFFLNPENGIFAGAIVAAFTQAVSYYLGSSQGAQENRDVLNSLHGKNNG